MERRAVALVSGADSEVLTAELLARGWTVFPLYVRSGFRWERAELARLRKTLRRLAGPELRPLLVADAPMRGLLVGHWSLTGRAVPDARSGAGAVFIPGRNMVLLTCAWIRAAAVGARLVALGTLAGNPFPDGTPEFRRAAQRALNEALGLRARLAAPFFRLSKVEVLERGRTLPLEDAFSCLAPRGGRACGRCNKCAELARARRAAASPRRGRRSSRPRRSRRAAASRPRRAAGPSARSRAGA